MVMQQYREFESGIHHQDCCINEHRIEPGPADRPKESMSVLMVSDLVVGVDGETGQVVCDPEEQDEYHVDDEVRGAGRNVRTGREGSSSGGEEWRNPKDLGGLEAEYVSKDEAEDGDADSQHQHQLCAVDEYLADLEDLGLIPLQLEQEQADGYEEESFTNIAEHQSVDEWKREDHEGKGIRLAVGWYAEIVDYALERPGPAWSLDKSRRISIRRRRGVLRRTLSMILRFFLDVH